MLEKRVNVLKDNINFNLQKIDQETRDNYLNWLKYRLKRVYNILRDHLYKSKEEFNNLVKIKNNLLVKIYELL